MIEVPATSVTTYSATGVDGMTTYRLLVALPASASNVYVLAGTPDGELAMPPAYQVALPFGVDFGGISPDFFPFSTEAEFDSWLTVGMTDGSEFSALGASPGLGLDAWTAEAELRTNDGAVFWMSPADAPGGNVVVAQLTVGSSDSGTMTGGLQGRSNGGADDWQVAQVTWSFP